jgi:putative phage-type endonuclease
MTLIREITDRQLWLNWRKEALTASDIAAVRGLDPWRSPLSVYAEKVGSEFTQEETSQMRRGRNFEPAAVEYLREDHPAWEIWRPNAFYLDDYIGLGATPDCLARDNEGRLINIQIKTVAGSRFRKWEGVAPVGYLLQTATENLLVNADAGILAVLVVTERDAELHEFQVPRHEGAERRIAETAREFWQNIRAGVAPQPDYQKDAELVAALYPPDPDVPVPLDLSTDNRIGQVLEERDNLKGLIKEAEGQVKAFDAEIRTKLAGAKGAILPGWKISNALIHCNEKIVAAYDYQRLTCTRIEEKGTVS